jgi:hypothetical protein
MNMNWAKITAIHSAAFLEDVLVGLHTANNINEGDRAQPVTCQLNHGIV